MSDPSVLQLQKFMFKNELPFIIDYNVAASFGHHKIVNEVETTYGTLLNWNKVLACLDIDDQTAMVYYKRSKDFKHIALFEECLSNMHWAEQYKIDKDLEKQKNRIQDAIKIINMTDDKIDENFFKLSYAPNPRLPFVIDSLKLDNNLDFNNHIITDQNLNIGDVVCVENPFFGFTTNKSDGDTYIEQDSCYQRCSHCFQSNNMNLIPCESCKSTMFCSTYCKDEAMEIYHKYECYILRKIPNIENIVRSMRSFFVTLYLYGGNFEAMKKSIGQRGPSVKTVFDYDLSNQKSPNYARNLMDIFDSYKAPQFNTSLKIFSTIFKCHPDLAVIWKGNKQFIHDFLTRHADNLRELGQEMLKWPGNTAQLIAELPETNNNFQINLVRKIVGLVYYPFFGLLNHSCVPNIIHHINEKNQKVLIVCRPIRKGEQLFVDYT